MPNNIRYVLLILMLAVCTGCETMHGAAEGFGKDVHNASKPDSNGVNAIQQADNWIQKNLW